MESHDALILQQASWAYAPLLDITANLHARYAQRHGMAFLALRGRVLDESTPLGFDKLALMRRMIASRYRHIFWVDADAAIVGDRDLREALKWGEVGMARHPGPPEHFNCGVICIRNTDGARAFLDEAMARRPGGPPWFEQQILNDLAAAEPWTGIFERLDDRWNSTVNANEVDEPVIMGWHGAGDVWEKAAWMRMYV